MLTLDPGDGVDWHYHTGDVWAVVKTGTLTEQTPCGGEETFAAGQTSHETEGRIHRVRNARLRLRQLRSVACTVT